jgi:hypothetical protein
MHGRTASRFLANRATAAATQQTLIAPAGFATLPLLARLNYG